MLDDLIVCFTVFLIATVRLAC